jgi:hypothetical protein
MVIPQQTATITDRGQRVTYDKPAHVQFVLDMRAAGITVRHYDGRFCYSGPAAATGADADAQAILGATQVRLQSDQLGLRTIFYPTT